MRAKHPGVALVTEASQLEVSRATHTAQVGQIQSPLSTLSSLSSPIYPCPAQDPGQPPASCPEDGPTAGHSEAPRASHLGVLPLYTQSCPSLSSGPDRLCSQVPWDKTPGLMLSYPCTSAPTTDGLVSPDHEPSAPATCSGCCHLPTEEPMAMQASRTSGVCPTDGWLE